MTVRGKVALVTGGASGLGKAAAQRLAREGAKVAVLGRSDDENRQVADAINAAGGESIPVNADISDPAAMQRAVEQVVGRWGRLDIVFANAGINGVWAPLEDLTPEDWQKTININLNGTFYTLKYAAPHLKKQGGSIIITSSVNGTRIFSNTGATAYSCTKAAQVAMAKMLALELAKHKVRVNVICPGAIESQIDENTEKRNVEREKEPVEFPEGEIPLTDGVPGKAEDVGDLVLFLASDQSKHISGTEIWIDGAQSLLQG
ncbi:MAG: SDR family oxidoreductase [Chloroflexi bacterium]|uniref:SDR family oxidoreductase n=1 Tax=Candidatus Flexifilum breve TaxID=3140694 RepID=UPI0031357675|nr:SDR family oxidoreductase [Chloroflexota bacterium]